MWPVTLCQGVAITGKQLITDFETPFAQRSLHKNPYAGIPQIMRVVVRVEEWFSIFWNQVSPLSKTKHQQQGISKDFSDYDPLAYHQGAFQVPPVLLLPQVENHRPPISSALRKTLYVCCQQMPFLSYLVLIPSKYSIMER